MLNTMRENAGSWIIKALLGIIVVAFIFMGAGSFNASRTSKVAVVNGENITSDQYQRAYYNILENLRSQFGNRLNDEMIKMLDVKKQAMDAVIDAALVRQAAEKSGLRIPDEELAASITRIPAFQNNGAFDKDRYKILLSQNRLTPEVFENMQKESLLSDQIRSLVTHRSKVSEGEAKAWYQWENTTVDIEYVAFKPDTFTDLQVTDKMITDYYNAHKEDYRTQPRIQARYVKFEPARYTSKTTVTPDEISQYYAEHKDMFKTPETVSARHILFKLTDKASDEEVAAAKKTAETVMNQAKAGEDFATLAKTHSSCPSKEKGGDLGSFTREQMVKPFSDAAFKMKVGDISEPVRTQFGWHIIKVEAHNPEATKTLEEATPQITETLQLQKAKTIAYDAAEALYNETFDGAEFEKNAKAAGLALETTDFFENTEGPKGVPNPRAFAEQAFKLPLMEISDIVEIDSTYYLIQAVKSEPEKIPELAAVKDKVKADALREAQKAAAEKAAEEFFKKAKAAGSLAAAAGDKAADMVKSTGPINRNGSIPNIGNDRTLLTEAFKLNEKNKWPTRFTKGDSGIYVIMLKERKLPPEEGFAAAQKALVDRISQQKQSRLYDAWISALRENSDIKTSSTL